MFFFKVIFAKLLKINAGIVVLEIYVGNLFLAGFHRIL